MDLEDKDTRDAVSGCRFRNGQDSVNRSSLRDYDGIAGFHVLVEKDAQFVSDASSFRVACRTGDQM